MISMFSVKPANQSIADAAMRPDPPDLYLGLWREGEVGCLFADSNLGKSIYAVQMADTIARTRPVLYVDASCRKSSSSCAIPTRLPASLISSRTGS